MITLNYITISSDNYTTALLDLTFHSGGLKTRFSKAVFNRTRFSALATGYSYTPVIGDYVWIDVKDASNNKGLGGGYISNILYRENTVEINFVPRASLAYSEIYETSWVVAKLGCDAIDAINNATSAHTHHTTKNVNKYYTLGKKKGVCIRDVMLITLGASASITDWVVGISDTTYVWPETFKIGTQLSPSPDKGTISQTSTTAKLISAVWADPSQYNVKTVVLKYDGGSATASQSSSVVTGTCVVTNKSIRDATDASNYCAGFIKIYDVSRVGAIVTCVITSVNNIPHENDYYDVSDTTTGKTGTDLGVLDFTYSYPSSLFTISLCDVPLYPTEVSTSTTDIVNTLVVNEYSPVERIASKLTLDNTIDCVLTADVSGGLLINGVLITGTGDVVKSGSSAANQIPKWVGTGYTLAASGITIDSSNNVASMGTLGCGAITSTGVVQGTGITITNTDNAVLTADSAGRLTITNADGYLTIGTDAGTYSYFITGESLFAFNKGIIGYNTNTCDLGSGTYDWKDLYMAGRIIHNGTTIMDASKNLSSIGTVGCGAITSTNSIYALTSIGCTGSTTSICYLNFGDITGAGPIPDSVRSITPSEQYAIFLDCANTVDTEVFGVYINNSGFSAPYEALFETKFAGTYIRKGSLYMGTNVLSDSSRNLTATSINASALPVFTTTVNGAVPNPGSSTGKYLRDDVTWNAAAGTGTLTGPASSTANALVKWSNTGGIQTLNSIVLLDATTLYPASANSYDLGSTSYEWRSLYLGTYLYLGTSQQGRLGVNASGAIETPDDVVGRLASFSYTYDASSAGITASSTTQMVYPSSVNTNSVTLVSVARITANIPLTGTLRVYATFYSASSADMASARIYKNGVAQGTLQTTDDTPLQFYIGLTNIAAGDYYQIYLATDDVGVLAYCSSFYVGYTIATPPASLFSTASS